MQALELFDEFMPGTDQYEVEEEVGHGTFSEVGRRRQHCHLIDQQVHPPATPSLTHPSHHSRAQVHRARDRTTGALVALKHMYLPHEGAALPRHVCRELAALTWAPRPPDLRRHPALVSLLDVRQQVRCGRDALECRLRCIPPTL